MNLRKAKTILIGLTLLAVATACEVRENAKPATYEGPLSEGEDVEMYYLEKDALKLKVKAKKVQEFPSGDREFPEGLYMEFYDEFGNITSTLKANHAYYFKKEYQWRGRGDVEVKNIEKNEQLNTEELFWKPDTKRIFTEKFVTIRQQHDIIYGTGLDAAQDLSDYRIKDSTGEFELDEEEEEVEN